MLPLIVKLFPKPIRREIGLLLDVLRWRKSLYFGPSPKAIKQAVLIRNGKPDAIWIETGTYLGVTTELLSTASKKVWSIEPEQKLYEDAREYFRLFPNVEIIHGLSEDVFPELLPQIHGDVNFWLDGHYSGGITHLGPRETPILWELSYIAENLHRFGDVCVLVDDVRLFSNSLSDSKLGEYPKLTSLVEWADKNKLTWTIEHDIFVAKSR
jgi:hypothetical protein